MPEWAEIRSMSVLINAASKNRVYTLITKSPVHKSAPLPEKPFDSFRVCSVSRGKELMVTISPIPSGEAEEASFFPQKPLQVLFRMGMSGKWSFVKPENLPKHAHCMFHTDEGHILCYVDARRFGTWHIMESVQWGNDRGPDPVDEYALFRSNILSSLDRKVFERPVCEVMLDQKYFNGVGNYLRAEILHRCGIQPFVSARTALEHLAPPSKADSDNEEAEEKKVKVTKKKRTSSKASTKIKTEEAEEEGVVAVVEETTTEEMSSKVSRRKSSRTPIKKMESVADADTEEEGDDEEKNEKPIKAKQVKKAPSTVKTEIKTEVKAEAEEEEGLVEEKSVTLPPTHDLLQECYNVLTEIERIGFAKYGPKKDYTTFRQWLQVYGCANWALDGHSRRIWFHGKPGPLFGKLSKKSNSSGSAISRTGSAASTKSVGTAADSDEDDLNEYKDSGDENDFDWLSPSELGSPRRSKVKTEGGEEDGSRGRSKSQSSRKSLSKDDLPSQDLIPETPSKKAVTKRRSNAGSTGGRLSADVEKLLSEMAHGIESSVALTATTTTTTSSSSVQETTVVTSDSATVTKKKATARSRKSVASIADSPAVTVTTTAAEVEAIVVVKKTPVRGRARKSVVSLEADTSSTVVHEEPSFEPAEPESLVSPGAGKTKRSRSAASARSRSKIQAVEEEKESMTDVMPQHEIERVSVAPSVGAHSKGNISARAKRAAENDTVTAVNSEAKKPRASRSRK